MSEKAFGRAAKYALWVLLILSPVILLLIQSLVFGRNLFLGVPEWSDELDYWREMYSFSGSGFSFGGSMFFGYDAKIGPMGAHSISPIAAWGLFFFLYRTGVSAYAIVWSNLVIMTAAWAVFVVLIKPDIKKSVIAVMLAFAFPLTVLYIHSAMIEMVCMAGMLLYFTFMYRWIKEEAEKGKSLKRWFVLALIAGIWCTMLRPTYVVILFPAIWMKNRFKINRYTIISMILYVVAFLGFYKLYGMVCADYPGWVTSRISAASGIANKLRIVYHNATANLYMYFSPKSADLAQVGMRYFYFLVMILAGVKGIISLKNEKDVSKKGASKKDTSKNDTSGRLYLSLFILMFGLWVMMILLYDILEWRDFRAFAPICFGVILLMALMEESKAFIGTMAALYAALVLMTALSGVNFITMKQNNPKVKDLSAYFEKLEVTDEAGNARVLAVHPELNWCDISVMSSVPAKLGFQIYYRNPETEDYQKADYVLLPEGVEAGAGQIITAVPGYGNVYKMF